MKLHSAQRALRFAVYPTACSILLVGLSSAVLAQHLPPHDLLPLQYAVKFICGKSDGRVLGQGDYFTAINVHNPNESSLAEPVELRKKFAIALPGEKAGGHTEFLEGATLGPDDAVEIDCEDIVRQTQGLCGADFCKGFAVIESQGELDIVVVYTVADLNTQQVTTLQTERVSGRCAVQTEEVGSKTVLFVPPHTQGDKEFAGNGPCVTFELSLQVEDGGTALVAKYRMHAYECSDDFGKPKSDFTAAVGDDEVVLLVASPRGRILGHNLDSSMTHEYIDKNHAEDEFDDDDFSASNPVKTLRFLGDTSGSEAGTKTRVFITLREMKVELETCAPRKRSPRPRP